MNGPPLSVSWLARGLQEQIQHKAEHTVKQENHDRGDDHDNKYDAGVVDDLLAGFYCEVDGDTDIHMDASELKLAEWKTRDEIELQPNDFSLTNEMMREFKEGRI